MQLIGSAKLKIKIAMYKAQDQWYSSLYRAVEGIAEGSSAIWQEAEAGAVCSALGTRCCL